MLTACSSTGGLFGRSSSGSASSAGNTTRTSSASDAVDTTGSADLGVYLELMRKLVDGDPLTRSETFNAARDAAEYAPTRINRLSYALALSVPGHPGFDADLAATRLRELIAAGPTLTPAERLLATIQLNQAEQIKIAADNSRLLEQQLQAADAEHEAELADSIRLQQAEFQRLEEANRALQAELEEMQKMLDAITNIEESLSGRDNP